MPELPAWQGPSETPVGVGIVREQVPEALSNPVFAGKYLAVGDDGSILIAMDGLFRILLRNGSRVSVELLSEADADTWRLFMLGSVLGYLAHQRGLFPLHAATLRVGGRLVAIAGHSGAGKSTLAAAMSRHGHTLLSDDMTVIDAAPGRPAQVFPTFPRLKLWKASLDGLGIGTDGLQRVRADMAKFDVRPEGPFEGAHAPLDAVIAIAEAPQLEMQACAPAQGLAVVNTYAYRPKLAHYLGRSPALFQQAAQIARSAPVYRLNRPKSFDALPETIRLIEKTVGL